MRLRVHNWLGCSLQKRRQGASGQISYIVACRRYVYIHTIICNVYRFITHTPTGRSWPTRYLPDDVSSNHTRLICTSTYPASRGPEAQMCNKTCACRSQPQVVQCTVHSHAMGYTVNTSQPNATPLAGIRWTSRSLCLHVSFQVPQRSDSVIMTKSWPAIDMHLDASHHDGTMRQTAHGLASNWEPHQSGALGTASGRRQVD